MNIQDKAAQMAAEEYPIPTDWKEHRLPPQCTYEIDVIEREQEAYIKGYTASKWIEVKEGCEMPEPHPEFPQRSIRVAVTTPLEVLHGHYSFEKGRWKVDGLSIPVLAWQPLPEPFKKEEKDETA